MQAHRQGCWRVHAALLSVCRSMALRLVTWGYVRQHSEVFTQKSC